MKKIILAIVIAIINSLLFTGCSTKSNELVGFWTNYAGNYLEFSNNGTLDFNSMDAKYELIERGSFRVYIDGETLNYTYSINDDVLTVIASDGDSFSLKRYED